VKPSERRIFEETPPSPELPGSPDIALRDVTEADLPIIFEHQRDPDATQMGQVPPRDEAAFQAHWTKLLGDESILKKAIVFRGHVAGHVLSFEKAGERQVGYWLGKDYWGKGIATRALAELLLLEKRRPLHARVAKHNRGSIRVLEKCGFAITGEGTFTGLDGEAVEEFVLTIRD
jgi:RimJ/RimL family protein N-acetyltransferase